MQCCDTELEYPLFFPVTNEIQGKRSWYSIGLFKKITPPRFFSFTATYCCHVLWKDCFVLFFLLWQSWRSRKLKIIWCNLFRQIFWCKLTFQVLRYHKWHIWRPFFWSFDNYLYYMLEKILSSVIYSNEILAWFGIFSPICSNQINHGNYWDNYHAQSKYGWQSTMIKKGKWIITLAHLW